jgi:hypothetical protein
MISPGGRPNDCQRHVDALQVVLDQRRAELVRLALALERRRALRLFLAHLRQRSIRSDVGVEFKGVSRR